MKIFYKRNISSIQVKKIMDGCKQFGIKIIKNEKTFLAIEPIGYELADFIKHQKGIRRVAVEKDELYSQCWGD